MRIIAVGLLLLLAAPMAAAAAASPGRFTFLPAQDGVFRLDTATGAVSLCLQRDGGLVCLGAPGPAPAPHADREERDATPAARAAALDAERAGARRVRAIDRVRILMDRAMHRLLALVHGLADEAQAGERSGAPIAADGKAPTNQGR